MSLKAGTNDTENNILDECEIQYEVPNTLRHLPPFFQVRSHEFEIGPFSFVKRSVEFLATLPPPLVSQRSKTRGGGKNPKISEIPDFGRFALGIWPKNTTKFSAAFGGQKGAKQGGGGKNPKNTTDKNFQHQA